MLNNEEYNKLENLIKKYLINVFNLNDDFNDFANGYHWKHINIPNSVDMKLIPEKSYLHNHGDFIVYTFEIVIDNKLYYFTCYGKYGFKNTQWIKFSVYDNYDSINI